MRGMGKTEADDVHAVCFVKTLIRVSPKNTESGRRRNGPTLFSFLFSSAEASGRVQIAFAAP
jgi:hypothetical protein